MNDKYTSEIDYLTEAIRVINDLRDAIPLKFSSETYVELKELLSEVNKKLVEKLTEEV